MTHQEGICKKIFLNFFTEADFRVFFLVFTANVWSRPPGPTLVPGVLYMQFKAYYNDCLLQVDFFHPNWHSFSKSVFLLDQPEEETEALADALNKVCKEIFNASLPDVHFQKQSSKSYNLATTLQNKMENLDNRQGRSIVFIIDRGADMVTPFMHDLILEPLCYDILQLDGEKNEFPKTVIEGEFQFNLQKSKDILWGKIRDTVFFKVYEVLDTKGQTSAMKNQSIAKKEILLKLEIPEFANDLQQKWVPLFRSNSLDAKQLANFQLAVSTQLSRLRNAKLGNEFPKHKRFVQKLLDKVDKFKDIIDLIKVEMSKHAEQRNVDVKQDDAVKIQEWMLKLSEAIADFIEYKDAIQTAKRDIDEELLQLLETTQKLPKLLRSKKLLELYQTMLLNIYKVMDERNLKQCVQIEERLTSETMSQSFFMDDDRLKKIKQDLTTFLSNPQHHVEDKLRLLLIFLINNNLSEAKILEILNSSKIPKEKFKIIQNIEKRFHINLIDGPIKNDKASSATNKWLQKEAAEKSEKRVAWKPFLNLMAEDFLDNSSNAGLKNLDLFQSVIDEGKLRRVDSLNYQDVKNVIFFMTGFITHSEISLIRSLNKKSEGCRFYLGSTRIHSTKSLLAMLDSS